MKFIVLLFAGMSYEAAGGWLDLRGRFEVEDTAVAELNALPDHYDWAQVVNLQTAVFRDFRRNEETQQWLEMEDIKKLLDYLMREGGPREQT